MATLRLHTVSATLAFLALIVAFSMIGEVLGASRALAGPLTCGETITADATLESDLLDCPNNGIVIGGDDITLDLNGHTVGGDAELVEACPDGEICDVGLLNVGHDGVTVMNGSVHGFAVGVLVADVRSNRIATVSSSTNLFFGILMTDSARSVVRDSSGNDNIPPEGDGMALFGSHDIRIVDNSFSRNGLGIHVEGSTNNLIEGNVISGNEGPGILMEADRNEIRSNKCRGNGICFILFSGNRNVIARNHVRGDVSGISVENGHHNVVARNVVLRVRRTGIKLGIREPPIGGGRNVLRRNFVKGSGGDAFQVSKKDDNSVLSHNIARGAGDDGFGVQSDSARLTSNRAFGNADLGIQAVLGVIDGGGNIARSNGDPRQCVHIACD